MGFTSRDYTSWERASSAYSSVGVHDQMRMVDDGHELV